MTDYRRCRLPGGTYFFTVNLANRRTASLTENIGTLRAAFRRVPVKHGYVKEVKDWPYSSFHRYVRLGLYPVDWAGEGVRDLDLDEG